MSDGEGLASLWKNEDWWAVWLGFASLIFGVAAAGFGWGIKAPKVQRWTDRPLDAFYSDVSVQVANWPAASQQSSDLHAALSEETAERFRYRRSVKYEEGRRKVSEAITWKSRYVMTEAERDALLGLVTATDHHEAVIALYDRAQSPRANVGALAMLLVGLGLAFSLAVRSMGERALKFAGGYAVAFLLASLAYFIASQTAVRAYGLPYARWALALG